MLPFVFEDGFGFERYVDYVLNVPMYFVYRNGRYIDVAGKCFRDFLDGRIPELKGVVPQLSDWADHLTTIFPEARLKQFLEMRGADGGTWRRICGLPALWVGIFYDQTALDAAWDMVKDWTCEERAMLRASVPSLAFKTPFRNRTVLDLAREMLAISQAGLRARAREDAGGTTEEGFLQPLLDLVERGYTRSEELLRRWKTEWDGDLSRLFTEYNFL
jgi:glutamate--cysteine ligase